MYDTQLHCMAKVVKAIVSLLQAAQVRKTCFAPPDEADTAQSNMYSPETHHFCTIHAGTYVQQVQPAPCMSVSVLPP